MTKKRLAFTLLIALAAACVPVTPEPTGPAATPTAAEPLATPTAGSALDGDLVLTWQSSDCDTARFSLTGIDYGKCGDPLESAQLQNGDASTRLQHDQDRFQSFEADTPAGKLVFNGKGDLIASAAEQRALAYWAQLAFQEAQSGRTSAAWGLGMSWHREGGIAGFCDDLAIYLDGDVTASSCRSQQPEALPTYHLTATQLEQLYAWIDGFRNTEYSYKDPAVADAMSIDLVLPGVGANTATDEDVQAMASFAAMVFGQAQQARQPTPDLQAARAALLGFFDALSDGDYAAAEKLYGGSYEMLTTWNPTVRAGALDTLWKLACTQNGLQCMRVRAVVLAQQTAPAEFKFTVEFTYADGSLFVQGPCCGDTGPSIDAFEYTVQEPGDSWKVMELPPYVP